MSKRLNECWAIKNGKMILLWTIRDTKRTSIIAIEESWDKTWEAILGYDSDNNNFSCGKITIVEGWGNKKEAKMTETTGTHVCKVCEFYRYNVDCCISKCVCPEAPIVDFVSGQRDLPKNTNFFGKCLFFKKKIIPIKIRKWWMISSLCDFALV